jgi:hypothetical protein
LEVAIGFPSTRKVVAYYFGPECTIHFGGFSRQLPKNMDVVVLTPDAGLPLLLGEDNAYVLQSTAFSALLEKNAQAVLKRAVSFGTPIG